MIKFLNVSLIIVRGITVYFIIRGVGHGDSMLNILSSVLQQTVASVSNTHTQLSTALQFVNITCASVSNTHTQLSTALQFVNITCIYFKKSQRVEIYMQISSGHIHKPDRNRIKYHRICWVTIRMFLADHQDVLG